MSITSEISDELIQQITELFGPVLRYVDTHPGQWSDSAVSQIITTSPAVYVAWLGSRAGRIPGTMVSTWGLFISADVLNGRQADTIGIYQIVERLTAWLTNRRVGPSGPFTLTQCANLWSDIQSGGGVAVYGLYFEAPQPMPSQVDEDDIGDYALHYQRWVKPDGSPQQEALIHLPIQEPNND